VRRRSDLEQARHRATVLPLAARLDGRASAQCAGGHKMAGNEKPGTDLGLGLVLSALREKRHDAGFVLFVIMSISGVVLIVLWPFFLAGNWAFVLTLLESTWAKIGAVALLCLLAGFLFFVRTYDRFFYGLGEIFIGIAGSWVGVKSITPRTMHCRPS
jgi:hypothetical protein